MALIFRFHATNSVKSDLFHFVNHISKNLSTAFHRRRLTFAFKETRQLYTIGNLSKNCKSSIKHGSILGFPHGFRINAKSNGAYSDGLVVQCKNYLKTAILGVSGIAIFLDLCNGKKDHFLNIFLSPIHAGSRAQNNFIADVVDKTAPAVVFIEVIGKHPDSGKNVTISNGSGFIVRKEGIVLTNAHVVSNKSTVSVKLFNGRVVEGRVVAVDPITDLAAVKINAPYHVTLTPIPLASSSDVEPGEWVIAMGSPLSLSKTVTCGIVSSIARKSQELGLRNKEMDYIQTDAIINFGNSGGPLVDLEGHVVGVNTMKVTTGISFAIPSDYAHTFLLHAESMIQSGITDNLFLHRRYIGITMLTLSNSIMQELKNGMKRGMKYPDVDSGVFVYSVIPGTPAYIGGIHEGDIITEINEKKIGSAADVYDIVETSHLLKVTLIRGNQKKTIKINTKERVFD